MNAGTRLTVGSVFDYTVVRELTRTQIVQYAGASGDFNPMHTDEEFARSRDYPSVFAHGLLTMGLTGRALTMLVGREQVRSFGGRFLAQVWPGDTLVTRISVDRIEAELASLGIETSNQGGAVVFRGTATAQVGGRR